MIVGYEERFSSLCALNRKHNKLEFPNTSITRKLGLAVHLHDHAIIQTADYVAPMQRIVDLRNWL